jgi:Transcription factor WhiB
VIRDGAPFANAPGCIASVAGDGRGRRAGAPHHDVARARAHGRLSREPSTLARVGCVCRHRPELFLPERGQSLAEPMSYCTRCAVRAECLREAFALGSGAVGVWGGTSTYQRIAARRAGWDAERLLAELDGR